ncbi:MAG: radical SAM protein [Deltaproteobacteria bacterium]|nr:radical SAM protein [Deltaproteobacteria bacterium]
MVKVQDGCDCRCTYCIVPLVRGGARSVPVEAAEAAVRAAAEAGAAEVVLTGVDLGAWGKETGDDLAGLLSRLVGLGTGLRFRLSSVEPHGLTDRLVGLMADSPDVCPHLHVPLQSGSDRVLAAMGRPYDSVSFAAAIGRAAGRVPGLALGMDVICGFPGEDEAAFEATRSLIAALPFTYLHVFPFSPRPGTPAASMPGAAPRTERDRRCRVLRGTSSAARAEHASSLVGRNVEVVDVRGRSEGVESLAADYTRVMRPGVQEPRPGRFEVKVAAADGAAAVAG